MGLIDMVREETGKISFSRLLGVAFGIIVLVLFVLDHFGIGTLPDNTVALAGVFLGPYVANVLGKGLGGMRRSP